MAIRLRSRPMLETLCLPEYIEQLNFSVNSKGQNPIMFAASIQNWDAVDFLSAQGMLIDVEDHDGLTLLFKTLVASQFDLAARLISRGSDLNAFNREGKTALSYFICTGRFKVVDFLMKMNANPHIEDFEGKDSCDYATQQGFTDFK
jgi:uncharacterized protein